MPAVRTVHCWGCMFEDTAVLGIDKSSCCIVRLCHLAFQHNFFQGRKVTVMAAPVTLRATSSVKAGRIAQPALPVLPHAGGRPLLASRPHQSTALKVSKPAADTSNQTATQAGISPFNICSCSRAPSTMQAQPLLGTLSGLSGCAYRGTFSFGGEGLYILVAF